MRSRFLRTPDIQAAFYSNFLRNWFSFGPILVAFLLYIGANPLQIAIVLGIGSVARPVELFAPRLMHKLSDRKRAMLWFNFFELGLLIAAGPIALIIPDRWSIPIFGFLILAASIMATVSGLYWKSLISDIVPAKDRGNYFGKRQVIVFGSGFAAVIAGGVILDSLGQSAGFRLLFIVGAVFLVLRLRSLRNYPNPPFSKSSETSTIRMMRKPFENRPFIRVTGFLAVFMFVVNVTAVQFYSILLDVLRIGTLWSTIMTALNTVSLMVASYWWGRMNKRYPTRILLMWSLPLIGLCWVLFAGFVIFPDIPMLVVIQIIAGCGWGGYSLLSLTYQIGDTPKSEQPAYMGLFNTVTGLASSAGGLLGGFVYSRINSAWLQSVGIPVAIGIVLLLLSLFSPYVLRDRDYGKNDE